MKKSVGNIRDITSRKSLEEELYNDAVILDLLENHSKIAIVKVDARLHAEYVSPSMKEVLGYPPDFFMGDSVLEVVHDEDRGQLEEKIFQTIEDQSRFLESEYRVYTRTGNVLWMETKARLFYDSRGKFSGAVYIQSDVTDRKLQEQKVKSALEEKDFLMKELNHRVKNNLALISALVTQLKGTIDLQREPHPVFTIRFPTEPSKLSEFS